MISFSDWIQFLKNSHGGAVIPLVLAGLSLMLFGWRMVRLCVVLAFGFIGAAVGAIFTTPGQNEWLYPLIGGAILAAASYYPTYYAVSLLGGIIGAAVVYFMLSGARVPDGVLWGICGVVLVASTAMAALNRRFVVIGVTSFLGAACLMSGLTCWTMSWPGIYGTLQGMALETKLVVPFMILVPMAMSGFFQLAEMRRLNIEL